MFPQLRDCVAVHRALEQNSKHIPLAAERSASRVATLSGSPEGSHYILCAKDKCRVIKIKFRSYHIDHGLLIIHISAEWS